MAGLAAAASHGAELAAALKPHMTPRHDVSEGGARARSGARRNSTRARHPPYQMGRKTLFQRSFVIFQVGSMLSGLTGPMLQVILLRAIQGIGTGGLMVGAQTIIADVVSPRDRGRARAFSGRCLASPA